MREGRGAAGGWLGLVFWVGMLLGCGVAAAQRPNVILILVDDQGSYDLGCYGAKDFQTPRIDGLAAEGVRFTDYYAAAPICSPSRAGLLTGCYPRRIGMESWVLRPDSWKGIHSDELTLAELFQESGYRTACIGKWHLGYAEPFLPRAQGFDHYFGILHNLDPVEVVQLEGEGGVPLLRNGEVEKRPADPAELTRLYTNEAIAFVRENRERPFFVYLAHTMLHVPLGVSEAFRGSSSGGEYGDAVQEMDHEVGRLRDALEEMGLAGRTAMIYTSDNGRGPGRGPEQPMQGRKLTTFECGVRVPCIAWGPGVGILGGRVNAEVVHAMDWYPTLASLAGIRVPEGRVIDGRDLSAMLAGKDVHLARPGAELGINGEVVLRRSWNPGKEWAEVVEREDYLEAFFYHGSEGALAAVRWRDWKLVLNPELRLFHLGDDPGETTPVRDGELVRKLRGMAVLFQEEMRRDGRAAGEISEEILRMERLLR